MEYGKADINDWMKHRYPMKNKTRDILIAALFGLFCICMGIMIGMKMPQYKAHVKDGVVKVMPIK